MIIFTSSAAALTYVHLGRGELPPDYAAALLALGFAVTLAGQACSLALVRALGRRSVIVFAMAALLVMATSAAAVSAAAALAAARPRGLMVYGSVCPAPPPH